MDITDITTPHETTADRKSSLQDLPEELLLRIALALSDGDLSRLARTNHAMYRICWSHWVWHRRFVYRFSQRFLLSKHPTHPPPSTEASASETDGSGVKENENVDCDNIGDSDYQASSTSVEEGEGEGDTNSANTDAHKTNKGKERSERPLPIMFNRTADIPLETLLELYQKYSRMVLPADDMAICHMGDRYWVMEPTSQSRFGRVATLRSVWWLDVHTVFYGVPQGRYRLRWRLKVTSNGPVVHTKFLAKLFKPTELDIAKADKEPDAIAFEARDMDSFKEHTNAESSTIRRSIKKLIPGFTIFEVPGVIHTEHGFSNVLVQIQNHDGWKSGMQLDYVQLVREEDVAKVDQEQASEAVRLEAHNEEINDEGEEYYPRFWPPAERPFGGVRQGGAYRPFAPPGIVDDNGPLPLRHPTSTNPQDSVAATPPTQQQQQPPADRICQKKAMAGEPLESTIDSLQKLDLGGSSPMTTANKKAGGSSGSKSKKSKKASGAAPAAPPSSQKKPSFGPVLLGLPDTPMTAKEDVDPYVTKIGGVPNWLDASTPAPAKYGVCESCGKSMFLLLQAYVPLEKSPYDRVIYVWACNQRKCMRNKGSVRVIRSMKLNPEYAAKLEKKTKPTVAAAPATNPFGAPAAVDLGNALFGGGPMAFSNPFAQSAPLGSNPFGGSTATASTAHSQFGALPTSASPFGAPSNSVGAFPIPSGTLTTTTTTATKSFASAVGANVPTMHDESSEEEKEEDTVEADDEGSTEWPEKPSAFQAHYLYITEEVLNDAMADDALVNKYRHYIAMGEEQLRAEEEEGEEGTGGASWGGEVYEEDQLPKGMDKALQKFTERVQASGAEQCVRYEFPGTPLLFSFGDETAKTLLPAGASHHSKHTVPSAHRIARCSGCGGPRAFEMQLMPNMLSMLQVSSREHLSEEEQASLKTRKGAEQFNVGMEWGTVLVYSCAEDCFSKRKTKSKKRKDDGHDNNNDHNQEEDEEDKLQTRYYEEVALVQLEEN
ncbi:hypothetical protein BGZ73_002325 [Actinomortierella ambigua]|nr:hypothetical protein BGZ73_002325 [Actinomortierella ambigua]